MTIIEKIYNFFHYNIIHHFFERVHYYLYSLFSENILLKLIFGGLFGFLRILYNDYRELFSVIINLIIIDFILGVINAIKHYDLSSTTIFNSVFKILVYAGILYVGYSIKVLTGNNTLLFIFIGIIILKDSISLLENLDRLGASKVFPILNPLMRVLRENKRKIENHLLKGGKYEAFRYDVEFEIIRRDYFPGINNKDYLKYYEFDIDGLEDFIDKILDNKETNPEEFIKWFKTCRENETIELTSIIMKYRNGLPVFKKYYLLEHNKQMRRLIEFIEMYLKQYKILTDENKIIICSKIIGCLKDGVTAGRNSDRNKNQDDYKNGLKT